MKPEQKKFVDIVDSNNFEELKKLIAQNINLYPIFYLSCNKGNLLFVQYLVEQGLDIHKEQDTPLRLAVTFEQLEIVQYLVEKGAYIDADNHFSIHSSIKMKNKEMFSYLHTLINRNYPDCNINYLRLSIKYNSFVIFKHVVDSGYYLPIDLKNSTKECCVYGNIPMFEYLMKKQNMLFSDNLFYIKTAVANEELEMTQHLYELYQNKDAIHPIIQSSSNNNILSWINSRLLNDKLDVELSSIKKPQSKSQKIKL